MRRFAALLERLAFTPARNGKLRLLTGYLADTPDPDRGWALAALTGALTLDAVKPAMLRAAATARVDPELFALSHDFVGDLAETIALIWPAPDSATGTPPTDPPLAEVVATLRATSRREAPRTVERLLDRLDPSARFALLKLVTGGLRVGVSARLAKQALADFGQRDVTEIEELWHGLDPPYVPLFAWLTGAGPLPTPAATTPFRPVMLSHALEETDLARLDPADFAAEWKWDGIRVQATADAHGRRLFSRTGDDIGRAFPDLLEALDFDAALDGELLVRREDGSIATFSDLQQRLNRKTVTPAQLRRYPAHLRAYDLLQHGPRDLRPLPFTERRAALEALAKTLDPTRLDLSPLLPVTTWEDLARLRAAPPDPVIEGVMLKRRDSAYVPGRPKGPWWK
ncbi:MAG TPA: cisplatin damage response ATP-dependent DNA ligase, partial [Amaricoccus sp.]|nr:cisplatin damage response ATP-dependent DNA ligase [Amaricoccus sp.]